MRKVPGYLYVLLLVFVIVLVFVYGYNTGASTATANNDAIITSMIMKATSLFKCPRNSNSSSISTNKNNYDTIATRMNATALTKGRDEKNDTLEQFKIRNKLMSVPDVETIIKGGIKNVRNLPLYEFIMGNNGQTFLNNASCAPFPVLLDIRFSESYWQTQIALDWTFHVFNAYWDSRELNVGGPSIRILGYADRDLKTATMYCQIWFENEKMPRISKVIDFEVTWYMSVDSMTDPIYKYAFVPYLLNCPIEIGTNEMVPVSVSVVANICDKATTNVKVHYEKPLKTEKVAVCVRAMNFPFMDLSIRLVEWLEIMKIFGVHKVFLYERNVHPNISKVLAYYEESKFVDVVKVTVAGGIPNEALLSKVYDAMGNQSLVTEIIPINDCLYRNLYNYEYLAVIDIDEFFVPSLTESWLELLQELERKYSKEVSSFAFQHTIFYPDITLDGEAQEEFGIPPFLNLVQEVYRACASFPRGGGTKCFHNPLRIKVLHNHYPLKCFGSCETKEVDESFGDLHHHRFGKLEQVFCPKDKFIIDTTLWKWKHEIVNRTTFALKNLNLI